MNVKSTQLCHIQACQDHLRTHIGQCSNRCQLFLFEDVTHTNNLSVAVADTSQIHMVKKRCWFSKINQGSSSSSTLNCGFAFFHTFLCHPRIPIRISLVFDEQKDIPKSVLFPISVPIEPLQNCLTHKRLGNVCPYKFRSRITTGSSMFHHDLGHLCRGRRIHKSGHSDFGILSNLGASSILTWM